MTNQEFIQFVAEIAMNDWKKRKIMLPSVVIAQAILESGWGKSELATKANALFGVKLNGWNGKVYIKNATEQNKDGSYVTIKDDEWRAYDNWEQSIIDHNDYIATRPLSNGKLRYGKILGNKSYVEVCNLLKSCGYATSLTYPTKLIKLIELWKLQQYDVATEIERNEIMGEKIEVTLSGGHGLLTWGKRCMKKLDPAETREWWLNDRICDKVESILNAGDKFKVHRCDDTTGRKDISITNRIKTANLRKSKFHICVHHNAGAKGGMAGGIVVMYGSENPTRKSQAERMYELLIAHTGLKGNRSNPVYFSKLSELKKTNMSALYLELGFMDSQIDTPIILTEDYAYKCAQAIIDFLNTTF